MGYSVPTEEQETTINFSRSDKTAYIWTSDTTVMTKLDKLCETAPEYYQLRKAGKVDGSVVDKDYIVTDKSLISFRSGHAKRELTEEQRKALADKARARFKK